MNDWLFRLAALGLLFVYATTVATAAETQIEGDVAGIEICTQEICGAAIFVGVYQGVVDGSPAFGYWSAAVNHESPLPELGETRQILGGRWQLNTWVFRGFFPRRQSFAGNVAPGGTLTQSATDIFTVVANLNITQGGGGTLNLNILLDHTMLPFRVRGAIAP